MPIKKAAKKALRQTKKKRGSNLRRIKTMKEVVKKLSKLAKEGKKDEARKLMPLAQKAIDKAKKRGVVKKNTAARKKSRLAKLLK